MRPASLADATGTSPNPLPLAEIIVFLAVKKQKIFMGFIIVRGMPSWRDDCAPFGA